MAASVLLITFILPKQAKFRYEFEKGRIWNHKDLISPYNFAILKTEAEQEADREQALKNISPIYQFDRRVSEQQLDDYKSSFDQRWDAANLPDTYKKRNFFVGQRLLTEIYTAGVLSLNRKYQKGSENYQINVLENNVAVEKNTSKLFTYEKALNYCDQTLKSNKELERDFMIRLLQERIQPNMRFDDKLTQRIEKEAAENVSQTRGMVQKGETIVGKGSIVNQEIYQKLQSYKKAFEENARVSGDKTLIFGGQLILVAIMVVLLSVFLALFRPDIYKDNRLIGLILTVVVAMVTFLSWAIRLQLPSLYYIPYCAVPIIIRILFDTRLALNIHVLVILIAGFFVPNSFEFAFYEIAAGMTAIYSIKNITRREQFLISALLLVATYLVSFIGISLLKEGSISTIDWMEFLPFVVSVLLTLLAYPLIYAFERIFGITSDLSLIELTNTNAPLLRELAFNAPGTFQHSLQVANLAEAAIYRIGGNALLVRAGALYHDIGKMHNPQFFIENQNKGYNPHDTLTFEESAQIIIQHVKKGVEMARKHNLPGMLIDFIRTHHGNTRVDYFYQSFLKNFPEKFVDEEKFKYPGPIPFSKETAVLMLADSVEAASRALKEPTSQNINKLVDRIIAYKLDQNQLQNSNITLKDLQVIRGIFKNMLGSIYHARIEYEEQ
ncbi:MAG: HDIG domain-containing protein [Mucilaginibacter polytrichastri]|nr:HDIG domain-containing protein [Mucilaginibacter polytrichastri]